MPDTSAQRLLSDLQIGSIRRLLAEAVNALGDHTQWAKVFHRLGRLLIVNGIAQRVRETCPEVPLWTDLDRVEDLARAVLRWAVDKAEGDTALKRSKKIRSPEKAQELRRRGAEMTVDVWQLEQVLENLLTVDSRTLAKFNRQVQAVVEKCLSPQSLHQAVPDDTLAAILNDPKASERHLRDRRMNALIKGRNLQLENLWKAWHQLWPDPTRACPELGRSPSGDEHYTIWAGRLKQWGQAVHACGCRARNALSRWKPPEELSDGSEEQRRARLALYFASCAVDPRRCAADIESALRQTCTEANARLLDTLNSGGWITRMTHDIEQAVMKKPRQAKMVARALNPAARLEPAAGRNAVISQEQSALAPSGGVDFENKVEAMGGNTGPEKDPKGNPDGETETVSLGPRNEVDPDRTNHPFLATSRLLAEGRGFVNLDQVDFVAILALAKPLSTIASRLAKWEHDGLIGDAGADMVMQVGDQWPPLESALDAAGMADRKTAWLVSDKRREAAARMLRDLACDFRKGGLGHDVFAKRLAIAVEVLEEVQEAANSEMPPKLAEPISPAPDSVPSVITVGRWSDLGIGIDQEWHFYAFFPCPAKGECVAITRAIPLDLAGDRWREVLDILARSADGRTARIPDLINKLGYRDKFGLPISKDQAEFDERIFQNAKKATTAVRGAMADLGRQLRRLVATEDDTTVFQVASENYQAAFTAGHLVKDQTRKTRFSWGSIP